MFLSDIKPEHVLLLAEMHVRRFERMEGARHVREDERLHYLRIWRGIVNKRGRDLAPFEQQEVMEAVESRAFDDLLGRGT